MIEKFIGIPFEYRKQDCYTILREVVKEEIGIDLGSIKYTSSTEKKSLTKYISSWKGWRRIKKIKKGAILIFTLKNNVHLGFAISSSKFLHSTPSVGSCIDYITPIWKRHLHSVWEKINE